MIDSYNEAKSLLERYPYFAYAMLEGIRMAPDKSEARTLKGKLAANIGDEASLREILHLNSESLADFYPDSIPPRLSTDETIDSFLDRFGSGNEESPLDAPAPNPDYASTLLEDGPLSPLPDDPTGNAIDAFLGNAASPQPAHETPAESKDETDSEKISEKRAPANELTESFAQILIKNKNYSKALTIIEELNLKNPEKSIYFADQIRFLKKLIINQQKKEANSL